MLHFNGYPGIKPRTDNIKRINISKNQEFGNAPIGDKG